MKVCISSPLLILLPSGASLLKTITGSRRYFAELGCRLLADLVLLKMNARAEIAMSFASA